MPQTSMSTVAEFYIVPRDAATLLGRKTSEMLAVLKVGIDVNSCSVNLSNTQFVDQKAALMTKFPKVFEGLGKLKGYKLKLHQDKSIPPVAQPLRRIPLSRRDKVANKLKQLEELGVIDITVFSDVSRNPGPQVLHSEPTTRTHADLHTVSSRPKISYSRNELFKIRRVSYCSLSGRIFADLKRAGLLHLRGCRAGQRDFIRGIKVIALNRIEVEGPRYALEHAAGVNKNNLISIPRATQLLNHQQRQQPLKFVLLNVRSIRKKTITEGSHCRT